MCHKFEKPAKMRNENIDCYHKLYHNVTFTSLLNGFAFKIKVKHWNMDVQLI